MRKSRGLWSRSAAKDLTQGAGSSMVNAERVESTMALLPGYFRKNVGYARALSVRTSPTPSWKPRPSPSPRTPSAY